MTTLLTSTEEEWQDDRGGVVVVPDAAQVANTTTNNTTLESEHVIMEDADGGGATVNATVNNPNATTTPVKRLTPERKQWDVMYMCLSVAISGSTLCKQIMLTNPSSCLHTLSSISQDKGLLGSFSIRSQSQVGKMGRDATI
jgi:hypothetical protein